MWLFSGAFFGGGAAAGGGLGSPMDAVLQVASHDGFVLAENNDTHGLDPRVVLTAPVDGTYIVRLYAFPAVADSSIQFSGAETYIYRLYVP